MDVVFWILIWVSSPQGGFSDIYGALKDCQDRRAQVLAYVDTLYSSECVRVELKFVKGVKQEYRRPSEIVPWIQP